MQRGIAQENVCHRCRSEQTFCVVVFSSCTPVTHGGQGQWRSPGHHFIQVSERSADHSDDGIALFCTCFDLLLEFQPFIDDNPEVLFSWRPSTWLVLIGHQVVGLRGSGQILVTDTDHCAFRVKDQEPLGGPFLQCIDVTVEALGRLAVADCSV